MVEIMEDLEEISMDDNFQDWITHINMQVDPSVRKELTIFLKNNQDVFTWSHGDVPGINPSVMVHNLNVPLSFPPVRQKRRVFSLERDKVITEDGDAAIWVATTTWTL